MGVSFDVSEDHRRIEGLYFLSFIFNCKDFCCSLKLVVNACIKTEIFSFFNLVFSWSV